MHTRDRPAAFLSRIGHMGDGIRINKYLSESGVCSRREADRALEAGEVRIGGRTAVLGDMVMPGDDVYYCGEPVRIEEERILIAFHKPRGVVCTTAKREGVNIVDYIGYPKRIFPIGRLDKDSTGLILLTNDGGLGNRIMRAANFHEKEYVVSVSRDIDEEFVRMMAGGVPILDTVTRPCRVWQTDRREFHIILTQGLNRQIRRMCEAMGCTVRSLKRVRVMNIRLGDLAEGAWRDVTQEEYRELTRMLDEPETPSKPEKNEKTLKAARSRDEKKYRNGGNSRISTRTSNKTSNRTSNKSDKGDGNGKKDRRDRYSGSARKDRNDRSARDARDNRNAGDNRNDRKDRKDRNGRDGGRRDGRSGRDAHRYGNGGNAGSGRNKR